MKEKAIQLLRSTNRKGIENLIQHLDELGFFVSPASTKYHNSFEGGLLMHSLSVYNTFSEMLVKTCNSPGRDSIILCSLLHDVCKAGAYTQTPYGYEYNARHPEGHAKLSLAILDKFIKLSPLERTIILFHMGMYGTEEFNRERGEYSISELGRVYNNHKVAKLFYFCDDMSAQFYEA